MRAGEILFPYMEWAQRESARSPWCLSQSGMPPVDPELLGPLGIDLGHPSAEAVPRIEARLAELFGTQPERVIVTLGASGAMLVAAAALFPGSRVAAELPSYEPVRALPRLFGAELATVERSPETGFDLDPERVRAALAGSTGPGHVFVTNLHNPSGVLLGPERVRALAAEAARAGGALVSCEVYMEMVPNAERVHAFALADNAVSMGSLTKAYGLGPLRLGWMVLGAGLARQRALFVDRARLAWVDPPTTILRAGLAALGRLPELLAPYARVRRESRPRLVRWLGSTPGLRATVPEHGLVAFPRVEGVEDTRALARYLAAEHSVDVVPGEFFGRAGHLRVGCGVPEATLAEALPRLARGIEAWRRARGGAHASAGSGR